LISDNIGLLIGNCFFVVGFGVAGFGERGLKGEDEKFGIMIAELRIPNERPGFVLGVGICATK